MRQPITIALSCFVTAAGLSARADAAVVRFNVSQAQSSAAVDVMISTPIGNDSDNDTAALNGTILAVLENDVAPFGAIRILELDVSTAEPAMLNFCLFQIITCLAGVDVTANAGDLSIIMDAPGPQAAVMGSAFTQIDNALRIDGMINIDAIGAAEGQIPEGVFMLDADPIVGELPGTIAEAGGAYTLTLTLEAQAIIVDEEILVTTDFMMIGDIVATGQAFQAGDLDCSGAVELDDAPLLVEALLTPSEFSGCALELADVNQDGQADGLDVAAFADAVLLP